MRCWGEVYVGRYTPELVAAGLRDRFTCLWRSVLRKVLVAAGLRDRFTCLWRSVLRKVLVLTCGHNGELSVR